MRHSTSLLLLTLFLGILLSSGCASTGSSTPVGDSTVAVSSASQPAPTATETKPTEKKKASTPGGEEPECD